MRTSENAKNSQDELAAGVELLKRSYARLEAIVDYDEEHIEKLKAKLLKDPKSFGENGEALAQLVRDGQKLIEICNKISGNRKRRLKDEDFV